MKSYVTVILFGALCVGASFVDHPTRDGQLVDIVPAVPAGLRAVEEAPPLEETEVAVADFAALEADTAPVEEPEPEPPPAADGAAGAVEQAVRRAERAAEAVIAQERSRDEALLTAIRGAIEASGGVGHPLVIPCREEVGGVCARGALDRFFEQLRLTALGEATRPARVSQFGDSLVVGDTLLAELRGLFGEQFGYGGHGFVFIGNPERPVIAEDLRLGVSDEWEVRTVVRNSAADPLFGLGGAMFTPDGAPYIDVRSADDGPGFTRAGLLYFASYDDLSVRVRRGDGDAAIVALATPRGNSALEWFELEPGQNRIRINQFPGNIRYYGLVLENETGVVLDNIGLVSSRASRLLRIDEEHWGSQVELRDPDVISLFYGVNAAWEGPADSHFATNYREDLVELFSRIRRVAPERDCLAIAPLVRGTTEGGQVQVFPSIPAMTEIQREEATRHECASWSAFEAAGGESGIQRWRNQGWLGSDLAHPSPAGYRDLARQLYVAYLAGFAEYLERRIARAG